nr:follistatin-related protein 3-like [Lytechinus pictus]
MQAGDLNSPDAVMSSPCSECPLFISRTDAVCGSDGVTYDNLCELRHAACQLGDKSIRVASEGICAASLVQAVAP